MKLQTVEYYFREVIISMIRNRWMSFASIGTVAVSLFILGVFLILVMNMNKMASSLESQVQISAYLNDEISKEERDDIERMTKDLRTVSKVEYIPKESALPNSFLVTVNAAEFVKPTADAVADLYGVEEVKYGQDVASNLFNLTHLVRLFGAILSVILSVATIFIIANTIRLTVFARRKEIAIMKFVGATDWRDWARHNRRDAQRTCLEKFLLGDGDKNLHDAGIFPDG